MNRAEKRQQQRFRLARHPDGRVYLRNAGVDCLIYGIRDVSNHGLSLHLDRALEVPSPVEIEYRASRMALTLNGVVAWCRDHPDLEAGGFMVGIELFCPQILLTAFRDVLALSTEDAAASATEPAAEVEESRTPVEAPSP